MVNTLSVSVKNYFRLSSTGTDQGSMGFLLFAFKRIYCFHCLPLKQSLLYSTGSQPSVLGLKLPKASTTSCANQVFWALQSKNICGPKIEKHCFPAIMSLYPGGNNTVFPLMYNEIVFVPFLHRLQTFGAHLEHNKLPSCSMIMLLPIVDTCTSNFYRTAQNFTWCFHNLEGKLMCAQNSFNAWCLQSICDIDTVAKCGNW